MKKQRLFLFLGILISFLFVTGCAASTELIADGANVTMLIDLDDIAVPKKAVKYTTSLEFPVNDVQVLGDVFFGDETYELSHHALGYALRNGDKIVNTFADEDGKFYDNIWHGELRESGNITYGSGEFPPFSVANFELSFRPEYGQIGLKLAEHPLNDPLLQKYQAHAESLLQQLNYPSYQLDFSGKYSAENLAEIEQYTQRARKEYHSALYYFRYCTVMDSPDAHPMYMWFAYSEQGLWRASLFAPAEVTSIETIEVYPVEDAYRAATALLGSGEYWLVGAELDHHYELDYAKRLYGSCWVFTFYTYNEYTGTDTERYAPLYEQLGDAVKNNAYLSPIKIVVRFTDHTANIVSAGDAHILISKYTDPDGTWRSTAK